MGHPLPLTGERTLPEAPGEQYWFSRHKAAYLWVAAHLGAGLAGVNLVEAGSGEGYGAELLRLAGAKVLAIEYDIAASKHCHFAYPQLSTVRANLGFLPVASRAVDVVTSLQVVEHLWDLPGFLGACKRALRTAGLLIVTTPNRLVFSPGLERGQRPTNPFHVEEFDAAQLRELVANAGFLEVEIHGLHHGARIARWEMGGPGIVAAQVAAVTGAGHVPPDLSAFVGSVTAADFVISKATDLAQDLVLLARA